MNETVIEHCKHKDCKYRQTMGKDACCVYILAKGTRRACKISECDKYEAGTLVYRSTLEGFILDDDEV